MSVQAVAQPSLWGWRFTDTVCTDVLLSPAFPDLMQAAAHIQQTQQLRPYITVDVPNGNVDKAWRALNRQVQEEGFMETAKAQQVYMKPSERRKLEKSASEKKLQQQEFR
jgi:ribosomal protein S21